MSYEKPNFSLLGLATAATRDVGHGGDAGNAGKHAVVYEGCTGSWQGGMELTGATSSTGGAYEVDE